MTARPTAPVSVATQSAVWLLAPLWLKLSLMAIFREPHGNAAAGAAWSLSGTGRHSQTGALTHA